MSPKAKTTWVAFLTLAVAGILATFVIRSSFFRQRAPAEWEALVVADRAISAVMESDRAKLLQTIVTPPHLSRFTEEEIAEFLGKALADEVSREGLEVVRREAKFGSLKELFPEEGPQWAQTAAVRIEDCVAFRLERNGLVAEIGIVTSPVAQIIRLNNIRQMALTPFPSE